jgi:hypothetical protein
LWLSREMVVAEEGGGCGLGREMVVAEKGVGRLWSKIGVLRRDG